MFNESIIESQESKKRLIESIFNFNLISAYIKVLHRESNINHINVNAKT